MVKSKSSAAQTVRASRATPYSLRFTLYSERNERLTTNGVSDSLTRKEVASMHVDQLQRTSAATRDAGQRILGDLHVQAGFLADQLVDVAQQRAAAGQHDAAFVHVRAQF